MIEENKIRWLYNTNEPQIIQLTAEETLRFKNKKNNMPHPCLRFALDEYESKKIEDLLYNQDHVIVKKSDNFYYSDKGTHSSTEVESYESLRITPFITLLQQFKDLAPEYIIKLVRYYYLMNNSTLTSFGTGTSSFTHQVPFGSTGLSYPFNLANTPYYTTTTGTYTPPPAPSTSGYYDIQNTLNVTDVPKL